MRRYQLEQNVKYLRKFALIMISIHTKTNQLYTTFAEIWTGYKLHASNTDFFSEGSHLSGIKSFCILGCDTQYLAAVWLSLHAFPAVPLQAKAKPSHKSD